MRSACRSRDAPTPSPPRASMPTPRRCGVDARAGSGRARACESRSAPRRACERRSAPGFGRVWDSCAAGRSASTPESARALGASRASEEEFILPSVGRVDPRRWRPPGSRGIEREVTNRWDGEAESQWIVAARLLYHLQYLVPYLSRMQRIHLPDRVELECKAPATDVPPARGSSRHMLLGAHGAALPVVG